MNTMLIGAAGYVGRFILKELLVRNIKVTAVIREDETLKVNDYNIRIEKKDILDPGIEKIMEQSACLVSSCIMEGKGKKEQKIAYRLIISKMRDAGIKYILVILEMTGKESEDVKKDVLEILKGEKDLIWTLFILPQNIEAGEKTGNYRIVEKIERETDKKIYLEDLAEAVVDELENRKNTGKEVTIEYFNKNNI